MDLLRRDNNENNELPTLGLNFFGYFVNCFVFPGAVGEAVVTLPSEVWPSSAFLNTCCVSGFVFLVVLDMVVGRCLVGQVDSGRFGGLVV